MDYPKRELTFAPVETIETQRLIMRRFTQADAEEMFLTWARDANVTRYMAWLPHPDIEETRRVIAIWEDAYNHPEKEHNFALVIKDTNKLIGSLGIVPRPCNASCEIGYCMGVPFWGKGYMTEAALAAVRFCFEAMNAQKVFATHHPDNPASGRVMQKCGMTRDGLLRRDITLPAVGICDSVNYSVLREEWEGRQK
ncbi:MAG: GNAT family N-acetyltransferase [Oscillospiraceae bacterium]|jgi:ribosomal-protein-alanine N-acetyltransferase|nr:GNAT family N-acetyltransferase [Oscillospiraceae bacterium]